MNYQEERFHKLKYPAAIDADGHFIEGPKLWLEYSEAKYKPRALQFKWTSDGVQYLEINGRPSKTLARRHHQRNRFRHLRKYTRKRPMGSKRSLR